MPDPDASFSPPPREGPAIRWWRDVLLAAMFLTRLPLGPVPAMSELHADTIEEEEDEFDGAAGPGSPAVSAPQGAGTLAEASRAFPLVGLGIGLAGAIVFAAAHGLSVPSYVAAALAVAAMIAVTGGLHEDGLADTADGLAGGPDQAERLAIMREPSIGTFAVIAVALSLILRVAAVGSIPGTYFPAAAIVAAACLSRGVLPALMHAVEPARTEGLAFAAGRPARETATVAAVIASLVALIALGLFTGIVAIAAAAAAATFVAGLARAKIGGVTGDVLGAAQQASEIAVLVVASAGL